MSALTDSNLKATIRKAETSRKPAHVNDGEGRGLGRLRFSVRPMAARTVCEWYAVQWRNGKRTLAKIGDYPSMPLKEAREIFRRDYVESIQVGSSIKHSPDNRPGTVGDLFEAYCQNLEDKGKPSVREIRKGLIPVAEAFGRDRPARNVKPSDVTAYLKPIFDRGAPSMADHVRSYIRAAFEWGIKSENDYRNTSPRRFRIDANPAASIPTEPKRPGTRWLTPDEFRRVWYWLENPHENATRHYCQCTQMVMLTGQRINEIRTLRVENYNPEEKTLEWEKTKNGRPHIIPLPRRAIEIIDQLKPNKEGWFFPMVTQPDRPVDDGTLYSFFWRQRDHMDMARFTMRDLRRTWKTLTGDAGVSKISRDLYQNHSLQDVSSKHYDRYLYLPDKRETVRVWDEYLDRILEL